MFAYFLLKVNFLIFRPAVVSTMSDAVRVTLVQSPGNVSKAPPSMGGAATITSATTQSFYKQVSITPPNPQKITAAPPAPSGPTMRIGGPIPASRMTVLPANVPSLQTVSLVIHVTCISNCVYWHYL